MADTNPPVIDSVTPDNTSPAPGNLVTITVAAHDADARTVGVSCSVVDLAGNKTPVQVNTLVGDPVKIDPASVVVTDPDNVAKCTVSTSNPLVLLLQL